MDKHGDCGISNGDDMGNSFLMMTYDRDPLILRHPRSSVKNDLLRHCAGGRFPMTLIATNSAVLLRPHIVDCPLDAVFVTGGLERVFAQAVP